MPVSDSIINTLFPNNDAGPTWTRDLSAGRKAVADTALSAIGTALGDKFDHDIVDLTDFHSPFFGPFVVVQNKATSKAKGYDAYWTARNPSVTINDLTSPYTWG